MKLDEYISCSFPSLPPLLLSPWFLLHLLEFFAFWLGIYWPYPVPAPTSSVFKSISTHYAPAGSSLARVLLPWNAEVLSSCHCILLREMSMEGSYCLTCHRNNVPGRFWFHIGCSILPRGVFLMFFSPLLFSFYFLQFPRIAPGRTRWINLSTEAFNHGKPKGFLIQGTC